MRYLKAAANVSRRAVKLVEPELTLKESVLLPFGSETLVYKDQKNRRVMLDLRKKKLSTLSIPEYPTLFFISKLINESNFLKTTKVKITGGHNSDKCGVTTDDIIRVTSRLYHQSRCLLLPCKPKENIKSVQAE